MLAALLSIFLAAHGLRAGEQSSLPQDKTAAVLAQAGVTGKDALKDAARLHQWMQDNFKSVAAGGAYVGKESASGLLQSRLLTGCHDWALLKKTLLHAAGYPAVMVDTAGTNWMAKVRAGKGLGKFNGHVFVELKTPQGWVLLDSTDPRYLADYDPSARLIPMEKDGQASFFVMFKGADPESYGITSNSALTHAMVRYAKITDLSALPASSGRVAELPKVGASFPDFSEKDLDRPTQPDPRRRGIVRQFQKAGVDVYVTKEEKSFVARSYPYSGVFGSQRDIRAFATLGELKTYLRRLED